jgi:prepilin-type N-terminal cleavage/methylation domain-containing protein
MWKYKIKKGFSLIEVMCSFAAFSIFFTFIVLIEINNLKLSKSNSNLDYYCRYMEALKNEITKNCTYNQMKELSAQQKVYILKSKIDLNTMSTLDIDDLVSNTIPNEMPYVKINVFEDNVLKIQILLHYNDLSKEKVIRCELYKGNYYEDGIYNN